MAVNGAGISAMEPFKKSDDPCVTAERLDKYLKRVELMFEVTQPADGPFNDAKKKALTQIWGGDDLVYIWETMAKPAIEANTSYDVAKKRLRDGLVDQTNDLFPVYQLFNEMPQGKKKIRTWMNEVLEAAKRCNFSKECTAQCVNAYTAERAARDAVVFQTSNDKIRKKALAEAPTFSDLLKIGQSIETAESQAGKIGEEGFSRRVTQHEEIERAVRAVMERQGNKKPSNNYYSDNKYYSDGEKVKRCKKCQGFVSANHTCPAEIHPCKECGRKGHWTRYRGRPHPECEMSPIESSSDSDHEDGASGHRKPRKSGKSGTSGSERDFEKPKVHFEKKKSSRKKSSGSKYMPSSNNESETTRRIGETDSGSDYARQVRHSTVRRLNVLQPGGYVLQNTGLAWSSE